MPNPPDGVNGAGCAPWSLPSRGYALALGPGGRCGILGARIVVDIAPTELAVDEAIALEYELSILLT